MTRWQIAKPWVFDGLSGVALLVFIAASFIWLGPVCQMFADWWSGQ